MKQSLFLSIFVISSFGCVTQKTAPSYVQTVNSDLYPEAMSRDRFYEEMGIAYAKDHQSEKAIDEFRLALLHNPGLVSARLALANEYAKTEMNHLAILELSEVLRAEPKNSAALVQLGNLYLSAQIYSKAKSVFTEALRFNNPIESAHWSLFYISKLENNDQEAEEHLNLIPTTEENRIHLIFEKAVIAKKMGQAEKASKLFSQLYSLNPHDRQTVLEMANVYIKTDDFDSAADVLVHYRAVNDFDQEISETLVSAAVRAEKFDLALSELDQQKKFGPDPQAASLIKAHVHFLASNYAGAKKEYLDVLREDPEKDEARFFLAQIYLYQDQLDEAKNQLSDLKPASSFYGDAQVRVAQFEWRNGKQKAALQRLERAQGKRPDQLSIYKAYGDLLIENKLYGQAVSVLHEGIGFFPDDEDLQIKSAIASYRQGNVSEFKASIDRALKINPANAEIYSALAELWYSKKLNSKEVEVFAKKALELKTKNQNIKPLLAWALLTQEHAVASVSMFEKLYEENPAQPFYAEALALVYGSADVTIKAQQMGQQALKLQNQERLHFGTGAGQSRLPAGTAQP